MKRINRQFFFDYCRQHLFDNSLKQKQVNGLESILDYWVSGKFKDDRFLAYILGTIHHEVDRTFQPINEYGSESYFKSMYDIEGDRKKVAIALGNTNPGDGAKYHGRGFVQLTGKRNYEVWSKKLDMDLVGNPDLALKPKVATEIVFKGMISGSFTGHSLKMYFNKTTEQWYNARKTVNHLDKAGLISGYARSYYAAISYKP